ncbi:MAG: RNA chaperone Hfq [Clostridiaceae bacterium]|nr:RNA chaperone Hfq [Clostridiaceae bacterium]
MYQSNSLRKTPGSMLCNHVSDQEFDYNNGSRESFRSFKNANLQEIFLNNCRKSRNIVSVFLLAGERRRGMIVGFDNESIILDVDNTQNLIYKSSITCVVPEEEVQYIFGEGNKRELCCANAAAHHN